MSGSPSSPVAQLRCSPFVSWGVSDDDLVLFDERDGRYHALNQTASMIWRALMADPLETDICTVLAAQLQLSPADIVEDVDQFMASALAMGLVVPAADQERPSGAAE